MATAKELKDFFKNIDKDKRQFAYDTIEEYIFFQEKLKELKKLPYIQVSKKNPEMQRLTPAAKLIKEYSQVLDAKRATLLRILNQNETSEAQELLEKLQEFE